MQNSLAGYVLSIMRIVIGFLYSCHGFQIILGFFGGMPPGTGGKAAFLSFVWFAGILELVGGLLVMFGLFTRCAAFVVSGEMAVAYFMVHFPHGFWAISNGGEPAAMYCFVFLFLAAAGGGPLSLDQLIWGKKSADT
jgi:putative oxidoreductase